MAKKKNLPLDGDIPGDAEAFIEEISKQLEAGYGFVPLIGAGFSAPSGAPLVHELKEYLQRCICITFGLDAGATQEKAGAGQAKDVQPWNPRTDQWPPFIDRSRVFDSGHWANLMFREITRCRLQSEPDDSLGILSESYGAMQEWRTALLFLSRLNRPPGRRDNPSNSWLGVPQQEVIDSCFREVLKDKSPGLGHRMLAALGGALRQDVVVTTNFDNLLERAFQAARNPLEVFEVPLDGKLPDWSTVCNVRSLVKIHGGRSYVRADYSLDGLPSEEDRTRFVHYLLSSQGRAQHLSPKDDAAWPPDREPKLDFKNHLLVIGFSASDRRIRSLIETAWKRLNPAFRVFWICYSERDVAETKSFIDDNYPKKSGDYRTILRHSHSGLFLLQLYQVLRRNIPPLGSIFPSVSRVTLPPLEPCWVTDKLKGPRLPQVCRFVDDLKAAIAKFDTDEGDRFKVAFATSREGTSGITSACARAYREIEAGGQKVCLWMDMNDICSADNLFEVLLESTYYRLGFEDWIPPTVGEPTVQGPSSGADGNEAPQLPRREMEIDRLTRSVNKRWVLFLNGYETPGANSDDEQAPIGGGWWESGEERREPRRFRDSSDSAPQLIRLLRSLCGPTSRLTVVVMTRSTEFLSKVNNETRFKSDVIELEDTHGAGAFFVDEKIVSKALDWARDSREKRRFLQTLVLCQRPRLMAMVWSNALCPEGDLDGRQVGWLQELENEGFLKRKPGGLIWIHSTCRQILRQFLTKRKRKKKLDKKYQPTYNKYQTLLREWKNEEWEGEIHVSLAGWYERVLDASEAPAAAFEAATHFCRAAAAFLEQRQPKYDRAESDLLAAVAILKSNSFLIQTHGYSRGSCRRLEQIAKIAADVSNSLDSPGNGKVPECEAEKIKAAVRTLWIVCTEVMRAIAREVGEDAKAYYRHRQAGRLACGDIGWDDVQQDSPGACISANLPGKTLPGTSATVDASPTWWRWRRWSCMLAIASRSYRPAQDILEKELGSFASQVNYRQSGLFRICDTQEKRVELLRMIEQSVELILHQFSAELRLKGAKVMEPLETESCLNNAEALVVRGTRLAARIRDADHSADAHDTAQANWCHTRLLMHRSVICSRSIAILGVHRYAMEPTGILAEAESKMRVSDAKRSRAELALIDLHRADARIYQAESIVIPCKQPEGLRLSGLVECMKNDPSAITEMRKHPRFEQAQDAKLKEAGALVADALRFLVRAEPVLRDRRRNVWWTTWYFERRLRVIALSLAVTAFDNATTPIPFLGLEAAMRATDTEADHLLLDSIRMIRVDSYRLAPVIDAYISCMSALDFRLRVDPSNADAAELPLRRQKMLKNLSRAHLALREVMQRRIRVAKPYDRTAGADETVLKYVHRTAETARRILIDPLAKKSLESFNTNRILDTLAERELESTSITAADALGRAQRMLQDCSLKSRDARILAAKTGLELVEVSEILGLKCDDAEFGS